MAKLFGIIVSLFTALFLSVRALPYCFIPTVEIDASVSSGEVSSRASGYLYGVAQNGVPTDVMVESLDISSVSQKVAGGLQHPVGDVDDVSPLLASCDYIVLYLQDCFDSWYYCHDEIARLRQSGSYDALGFMREKFFPEVTKSVAALSEKEYSNRIVYCPYNECDNAVWFGSIDENGNTVFDEAARELYYRAWAETCELIRSIDSDAMIGGPGYCSYNSDLIYEFLNYTSGNACLPDIMIYHELSDTSALYWEDHVSDYRATENDLGIAEIPVVVTEYGTMEECGNPTEMLHYITAIENSSVYGEVAFWRLADNLCDTAADNNTPNSNWWLYRLYTDMEGSLLKTDIVDVLHSDFANVVKYGFKEFHYDELDALSSMTNEKDKIEIICGGADYTSQIVIKNLRDTALSGKVNVKIEGVYYEGLSGEVISPVPVKEYTALVAAGRLLIPMRDMDSTAVYHITITPSNGEKVCVENNSLPERIEFEDGKLSGNAYTYNSAYATTGGEKGMVGGLENDGDSVSVTFRIKTSGTYSLRFIYGNSNDGTAPDDRADTSVLWTLDGETQTISLPNTIKSEYTACFAKSVVLEKGVHTLTLAHSDGTFVADSLLIVPNDDTQKPCAVYDMDNCGAASSAFLAIVPSDGYYELEAGVNTKFTADSAEGYFENGSAAVYLRKGLNSIIIDCAGLTALSVSHTKVNADIQKIAAGDMTLSGSAQLCSGYVDGITSEGGAASFNVSAKKSGTYRCTLTYVNNAEGGTHAYNVDLLEQYITVSTKNAQFNVWCANTKSLYTKKTVTFNLYLTKGDNMITFSNNGENKFNNNTALSPRIFGITVNEAFVAENNSAYAAPETEGSGKYLFVHFLANAPEKERICFAVSEDGYNYEPLNNNEPVIIQTLGKKCVRDPYVLRGNDGYFYIIGTDMKSDEGWTSNHALVSWKSADLITWTDETIIDIRDFGGEFSNTNRAWAPQAIYDESVGKYMVYWANSTVENDVAQMYYAYTEDFKTITPPQQLYVREGIQTIDGDITYNAENGYYYLYFKHDEDQTIAYVKSKCLTGPYEGEPVIVSLSKNGVEGSSMFNISGTATYVMMMDEYGTGNFFAQQTTDMENFTELYPGSYSFNGVYPRHGSFIAITDEEYNALVNAFGK